MRGGARRRSLKCWRRTKKSGGKYTVCSGSKGQKKRRSKRIRSQKRKSRKGSSKRGRGTRKARK